MKKKGKIIIVTGGNGRFAQIFKSIKSKYKFIFPSKKQLDITNKLKIINYLKKIKPYAVLHLAGLSRPMSIHNSNISKSINLNIVGTANVVTSCEKLKVKIIYMSTSYVYEGKRGNYKETDPVLPWNNYAWSKLGGECSVQMYKNSLILRACVTQKPFIHKEAFSNVNLNFIFHDEIVPIMIKLFSKKGIYNVGGKTQTVYQFAKKYNKKVKKKLSKGDFPLNPSINLSKIKKSLKDGI
tara:strand:- start:1109 stop:1825 length:717 start_codon:yes stop_codon:yes gene_type:complete